MNTVFHQELIGWTDFEDNQLLRCPVHKEYEAKLLLDIPHGSSFLDVGAHFGDTVLTMALYAKNNNRDDIRFFAFEPNRIKCEHISRIAELNGLNVRVFNTCVGNRNGKASNDGIIDSLCGASSYKLDTDGDIDIMKLDDIKDILMPIGIIHIDTEGWETAVLQGASDILSDSRNSMFIIAECWDDFTATNQVELGRGLGVASVHPEKDILSEMSRYECVRLMDLFDMDNNIVFKVN